jgi:hypothetical protein
VSDLAIYEQESVLDGSQVSFLAAEIASQSVTHNDKASSSTTLNQSRIFGPVMSCRPKIPDSAPRRNAENTAHQTATRLDGLHRFASICSNMLVRSLSHCVVFHDLKSTPELSREPEILRYL